MRFTSILKEIIEENVKSKYLFNLEKNTKPTIDKKGNKIKPKMSKEIFDTLVMADPTTILKDVNLSTASEKELGDVKAGSYVPWLVDQYLNVETEIPEGQPGYEKELKRKQELFIEDLSKVTTDLRKYERFKNKLPIEDRQIQKLTPHRLYQLVRNFSLEKTKGTAEEKKSAAKTYEYPGGEVTFKGPNWTVIKITDSGKLGKDAACFYGGYMLNQNKDVGETRWCTSGPGLSFFETYIKKGPLYVIIPNNWDGKTGEKTGLPATRYQFHFPDNQFMDADDRPVDLIKLLNNEMSELKEYFKPEFLKGLTVKQETVLRIDNFSGPVGKFVSLYGIQDIFNHLPDNLEILQIINTEYDNLLIKIPEKIGNLEKLKTLTLTNCIDEIPNSVCKLNNLRFLTLENNINLKNIPSCIAELPSLAFLNLRGCINVNVPSEIEERGFHLEDLMWDMWTS